MSAGRLALPSGLAGMSLGILIADLAVMPMPEAAGVAAVAGGVGLSAAALAGGRGRAAVLVGSMLALGLAVGAWRHWSDETAVQGAASVATLVGGGERDLMGRVVDEPRPRSDRLQLVIDEVAVAPRGHALRFADRLLVWLPRGIQVEAGDRVLLRARLELPRDFDGFAYREYLARQRIGAIARAESVEVVGADGGAAAWLASARNAFLGGINRTIPEPEAALGAGILLGVRASIAPEINEAFERAGLTHVVAISGWNIAMVAALMAVLARPLERRPGGRWTAAAAAVAAVGAYVVLTGATPSVVRAALMAGALLVARLGGSTAHATSALGLAALVMLLAAPALLWDVGFQLSLLATGGLIAFGAGIERRLSTWPALVREPVALTLAAQITTLPVILVNFERLSLVAPVANVLVVPLVPVAMLLSAIASATGVATGALPVTLVGEAATWLASGAAWLVLRAMIAVGMAVASIPYASVEVSVPAPLAAAWLPLVALASWALRPEERVRERAAPGNGASWPATFARRALRPLPISAAVTTVLAIITIAGLPDGRLHVTVLDVGQGDAILVETGGGATVLVDGGPDPELTLRRLGASLPFFQRRIDLLVLSHPHQDHVAGLVEVLDRFRVATLLHAGIDYGNQAYDQLLADAAARRGVTVALARAGQLARLDGSTSAEILYPGERDAAGPLMDGDINNGSIVLLLRHGNFEALLTGDAEAPVEQLLLQRRLVPPVELLKVGHHGSSSSTTMPFVEAADPDVAIISSGTGNEYGHPAFETLRTLAGMPGLVIHRTDLDGDVEVVTDGVTYQVRTSAGWTEARPLAGTGRMRGDARSIGSCPSPTARPHVASSKTQPCRRGSSRTPREWPAWLPPAPGWSPRRRSPSTARWSRPPRCCTTSTRSRSGRPAASMESSAHDGWRPPDTPSSRCRSPPIP